MDNSEIDMLSPFLTISYLFFRLTNIIVGKYNQAARETRFNTARVEVQTGKMRGVDIYQKTFA